MGSTDLKSRKAASDGSTPVYIEGPSNTFGALDVSTITPQGQGDFVHGVSDKIFTTGSFTSPSVTATNGMASVTTGTAPTSWSQVALRRGVKYRPGQGSVGRITALYDTPVANNYQLVGLGNNECGYFIGYQGTDFGILHQETSQVEIRALTVTTGAGTETVTVTLDGTAVDVDVVGGSDTSQTAYQLATFGDYSQAGDAGFTADVVGSVVYFRARKANSTSTGTYSVSGTGIVGTFAQTKAGTDPTLTFIPQSSFNGDRVDGSGPSGLVLDPQKGNVYQVEYQYLGFGNAKFRVEDPDTGKFIYMHSIKNANNRTTPVLKDPNSLLVAECYNVGNTSAVTLKTVSMGSFIDGVVRKLDPKFARSFAWTSLNSAGNIRPLALIKADSVFNGETSYGEFDLLRVGGSNEANNQTLTVSLYVGAEIEDDVNYVNVDETRSTVSIAELDPSNGANTISNLADIEPFYEFIIGGNSSVGISLEDLGFVFNQNDPVCIAVTTSGQVSGQITINWFEQQ